MASGEAQLLTIVGVTMGGALLGPLARATSGIGGLIGPLVGLWPLLLIGLLALVLTTATMEVA